MYHPPRQRPTDYRNRTLKNRELLFEQADVEHYSIIRNSVRKSIVDDPSVLVIDLQPTSTGDRIIVIIET